MARWQNGHAAACKAVYAGSIPALASTFRLFCSSTLPGVLVLLAMQRQNWHNSLLPRFLPKHLLALGFRTGMALEREAQREWRNR